MMAWIILPIGIGLFLLLHWLTKTDTWIGQALRESDHQAWQFAVEDKERELEDLRSAEPKR